MRPENFMKKFIACASFVAVFSMASLAGAGESVRAVIGSPDGKVEAAFYADQSGRLSYEVYKEGSRVIENSSLGIKVDGIDLGRGVELPDSVNTRVIREEYSLQGNHSRALNYCNAAEIPIKHKESRKDWILETRVFDDGFAFRYVVPGRGTMTINGEATSFRIPSQSIVFYQRNTKNNEGLYKQVRAEKLKGAVCMPATVKLAGGKGYLAITEAAVYNYSGMTLEAGGDLTLRAVFLDDESWQVEADMDSRARSPWRVIMVVGGLNDLVNCDVVYHLSPPPMEELFTDADDWIKPGRALWSWWSQGTGDYDLQIKYIDAASELGFEHYLIDAGWEAWSEVDEGKGRSMVAEAVVSLAGKEIWDQDRDDHWNLLAELVDYAEERGVSIWVWKQWQNLADEDYRSWYFKKVKEAGAVGVKIDYMDNESKDMIDFYEAALKDAARHRLMVNFHGANKPTGEARTYPNEMTREGVRGLEYNKFGLTKLSPCYNAALPFTRFIAGHGDYTPVTFNPKKLGKTSYAHQLAMPIVFLSPLTHYADRPENYLDNPAAAPSLDVLKSIPTVWDETIVLEGSAIGESAAFARRSGDKWFIGILNHEEPRSMKIDLSFLGDGRYKAIILADSMETKAAFIRSEKTVEAGEELDADMLGGGGFVVMMEESDE